MKITENAIRAAADAYWGRDVQHGATALDQMRRALEAALPFLSSPGKDGGQEVEAVANLWDGPIEELSRAKAGRFYDVANEHPKCALGEREAYVNKNWQNWREDAAIEVASLSQPAVENGPKPAMTVYVHDGVLEHEHHVDFRSYGVDKVDLYASSDAVSTQPASTALVERLAAFDRDYPEFYWHVAKGKICAGEPLYGAIITRMNGTEIGHGESNVSAEAAFEAAFVHSGLPALYASHPTEGER